MPESFSLATATADDFAPLVGSEFPLGADDGTAAVLTLTGANAQGPAPAPGLRAPFSLLFDGPTDPALGQGTYRLTHLALGPFDLFLVPVGADAARRVYQAVFN